ncbi:bifunctional glutamate N-acetyltransferase/amino-acid acetyltransferase ArgJ [Geomonas sp. Red69]|uniref:Arginine biosynthesis bifunctional protein ArgJ n=1 Tax=Geomonas diazotrophica TaxID=2843197 RepID=A0ABX8JCA2_9BACT|nr:MULTISPECIES: bifunctional glutamate N-acetyltransferase/amino-acid acetyltransferase ArgJ [Geomonas]MBU5636157.1 bifunctional glutamate N-acetyltransferase/amino-acid acetyltransferase ArgJ [Geomonas diazotrophica]QWV96055.1 bifunctional glutamate N-acetyltransferase/amino-acid acetyltransferase ArgJ [Geomonas nitrogeniifigens]QXE85123.1 bifunctional glutamate N-acetyltransferase/amino-acid acetyltransferase ArgJ [Geomonas nitrogeniifigens]
MKGFRFSAVEAAIKKPGRLDLALIFSDFPAQVAAVYTTNKVQAAPVIISRQRSHNGKCRALLVNSGNANACTGQQGMTDALECGRKTAEALGLSDEELLIASTGVIGQPLPMERFRKGIQPLVDGLDHGTLDDVAKAIMTTDTFEKIERRSGEAGGKPYSIWGIAKGAGMIHPNMATMLSFLVTDAEVDGAFLKSAFAQAVDGSFNAITVDNDTSTNDTALIFANGAAGNPVIKGGTPEGADFAALLHDLLLSLAKLIVKDGEGATKFVEIRVKGGATQADAKKAALAVANSMLVKTAFFGQDANWGRIIAAIGYSGAQVEQERVEIRFDDVLMATGGIFAGGDAEAAGTRVLQQKEFKVAIDLKIGGGEAVVYTSDLSYDYVRINADYRT